MRKAIALILVFGVASAAPVPKELKRSPEVHPGNWRIDWSTRPYSAVLAPDGGFHEAATADPSYCWDGTWAWDGTTRTLRVSEWHNCHRCEWSVILDDAMKGTTDVGIPVALAPR